MLPAETADAVPTAPTRGGKRKRIHQVVSFASELERRLPLEWTDPGTTTETLTADIQGHIGTLSVARTGAFGDGDADRLGTSLWNRVTRLKREIKDDAGPSKRKKLLLCTRVFAFQLLDIAQWSEEETKASGVARLLKVSLKASRSCIDENDLDLALLVLQRAADYNSRLHDLSGSLLEDEAKEQRQLEVDYLIQRTALAWRENRFDVAEHMYGKIDMLTSTFDSRAAETTADVLFEMGKDLSAKEDFPLAVKWLDRAYDVLNGQDLEQLSRDGVELRVSVVQSLVGALLGLNSTDASERARSLVTYIGSELGDKPAVLIIELQLLLKSPAEVFDSEAYAGILRRMVKGFSHSDCSFKLLLHHIRKLHDKSPGLGCSILDEFLLALRISPYTTWTERLVTTRVWMTTVHRDAPEPVEDAERVLSQTDHQLSADAVAACHTLIWKKIESNYLQGMFELSARWCQLALIDLFRTSGPLNVAKIQRKLVLCALGRNDFATARSTFFSMSDETQREPLTRYLLFKVAVRTGDQKLAMECLSSLCSPGIDRQFIYACVVDSQQQGDRECTMECLRKLASTYDRTTPNPVHLPALFRCTIRLTYSQLESEDDGIDRNAAAEALCGMFDEVNEAILNDTPAGEGSRRFCVEELEWFCRNAYNLGLKHSSTWNLRLTIRILTSCVKIMEAFPADVPLEVAGDLSLKKLFCHFIISSALVALARAEDNRDQQLADYGLMREHIAAFDTELQPRLGTLDAKPVEDLLNKLAVLFVFDFEGAATLGLWNHLGEVVLKAAVCKNVTTYQAMGDFLLRSCGPPEDIFSVMRSIINQLWELEGFDTAKLCKYNRCLFQVTLPRDNQRAFHLLEETCRMAREAMESGQALLTEEVEWMATTAFNEAVDWFGGGNEKRSKYWAEKAMMLAHYCDDQGRLEAILQQKYLLLRLDKDDDDGDIASGK